MLVSGIYALDDEINETENGISTGSVDIQIKEYNGNNQLFDETKKAVMPGDEITLIPRINNLGVECYLRVKINYSIGSESFSADSYIDGNYSSWTKKGDYYYYDSVLSKKGSIDLFNKITIPNLSEEYYGKTVMVHIIVEAVQAKNFDGNWNDVEIKKSVDRTYDIDYEGESSVIYEDGINHHITLGNNFFDHLVNMLPGDKDVGTFSILNSSDSKIKYYLSIDYKKLSSSELALLKKINLVIKKSNGQIISESNLADKDKRTLGIYSKGEGDSFIVEISLPKNIDNNFSKLFTKIIWIFSCEVLEQHNGLNPQTWDYNFDLSITVFLISTVGFIIVLFLGKKEADKNR